MALFRCVRSELSDRAAAAALAVVELSPDERVSLYVDLVDARGGRYCPKALEQLLLQELGDPAAALTDGITSFDRAIPLREQAAWLEADGAARDLFATDPSDVARFEELLSEWRAALGFAQASFEARGGLLPEEQAWVDRAADSVDVYAAVGAPLAARVGVSTAEVLRERGIESFESTAPVPGFHCIEIADVTPEFIEEEFFPPEVAEEVRFEPVVVVDVGELGASWYLVREFDGAEAVFGPFGSSFAAREALNAALDAAARNPARASVLVGPVPATARVVFTIRFDSPFKG